MSLYYCPACGQLYRAASAKYTAFLYSVRDADAEEGQ